MTSPVYLDNNATTCVDQRVLEKMLPYFTKQYGNASSRSHGFGLEAAETVEFAREQAAALIGAEPRELIFTSGATESVNLALRGVMDMYAQKGNHLIVVSTEHKAVLDTASALSKKGTDVTVLPVEPNGLIDLDLLESSMKPETVLVAVMYANNETGVIQPVEKISAIVHKHGALFFTDATQAVGKIPVDVNKDGIDLMAFSAHKFYGPKGVGALYIRRKNPRVKLTPQMEGGGHERVLRSGTLNVPGIVGMGAAAAICSAEMPAESKRIAKLRDRLERSLFMLEEVNINGDKVSRLPHVCNLTFQHIEGESLLMGFNKIIAVSNGSACSSALAEPSHVLTAMGLSKEMARSTLRFSLGRFNTEEEIDFTIRTVSETVINLREISPLWEMYKEGINPDDVRWNE